jgi:3-dehydroquinate synthase
MKNFLKELQVSLSLSENTYPVFIGENLLASNLLQDYILDRQVMVITNEKVAALYLEPLMQHLKHYQCDKLILPDGEEYKNLATLSLIFDALIENRHRRNTTLIGIGGGVIGDITGFAAACYQRGVAYIQFPTSLLAQVDASIGGKTAINHPLGKNMIGAFYQPKAVLIDINTLTTLPEREFHSGLAEIIKVALIADAAFFDWLEEHIEEIMSKQRIALVQSISKAVAIKIKIVMADEKEQSLRALLNLGHTFGHGIEQSLGYGTWLHGEAVSVGIVLATHLSVRLGLIQENAAIRVENLLTKAKLPIRLPTSLSAARLIEAMETDKKKESTELKLILLKKIGQATQSSLASRELLEVIINENRGPALSVGREVH